MFQKQSLHGLFGFFYGCHKHITLLNLLYHTPEKLSQSRCHKKCPKSVPKASERGVKPTGRGKKKKKKKEKKKKEKKEEGKKRPTYKIFT